MTKHFKLQPPDEDGNCVADYVEFYDGPSVNDSQLYGRFCGSQKPNFTGFPTQRYMAIRFRTDETDGYTGFKFMATKHKTRECDSTVVLCKTKHA